MFLFLIYFCINKETVQDESQKLVPPSTSASDDNSEIPSVPYKGNLVCIGVLPGLESYANSSSDESDNGSTSDSENASPTANHLRDLCGRKIVTQQDDKNCSKEKK